MRRLARILATRVEDLRKKLPRKKLQLSLLSSSAAISATVGNFIHLLLLLFHRTTVYAW